VRPNRLQAGLCTAKRLQRKKALSADPDVGARMAGFASNISRMGARTS
jgi:hypothetical protein